MCKHSLLDKIDAIKEKLTDAEYKDLVESVAEEFKHRNPYTDILLKRLPRFMKLCSDADIVPEQAFGETDLGYKVAMGQFTEAIRLAQCDDYPGLGLKILNLLTSVTNYVWEPNLDCNHSENQCWNHRIVDGCKWSHFSQTLAYKMSEIAELAKELADVESK